MIKITKLFLIVQLFNLLLESEYLPTYTGVRLKKLHICQKKPKERFPFEPINLLSDNEKYITCKTCKNKYIETSFHCEKCCCNCLDENSECMRCEIRKKKTEDEDLMVYVNADIPFGE